MDKLRQVHSGHLLPSHTEGLHRTRMPTSSQDSIDLLRRFPRGHIQSRPRLHIPVLHRLVRTKPRQLVRTAPRQQDMQLLPEVIRRIRSKFLTLLR